MGNSTTQAHYINEKQVSSENGVSHNSIRASRSTGLLWGQQAPTYLKIGTKVLYKREVIEAWFAQFEQVNNTAQARMGS